jgi:hypothetical protein
MGIGLRVFLVRDDESIQRLSLARYERLLRRDPQETLPKYASRRVRYALVILELEDRRPVEIIRIQYSFLSFDSQGSIDAGEQEREARLASEMLPPITNDRDRPRVVDARHRFAKKRYDDDYRWIPSPEIEAEIVQAVFGKSPR